MSSRAEAIRRAMGEEEQAERDDERFRPVTAGTEWLAQARVDAYGDSTIGADSAQRLDAAHFRLRDEAERDPWDLVKEMTALVGEMSTLLEAALDQMRALKRN